jgi:hypothetical protein
MTTVDPGAALTEDDAYPAHWLNPQEQHEERPEILDRLKSAHLGASGRELHPDPDYPPHWTNRKADR